MSDEVLSIKEIAERVKLAERTVYSMAQRRELPMFKVRGQWRIHSADFDDCMEEKGGRVAVARRPERMGADDA